MLTELTEISATQFEKHAGAMLAQVQQNHRSVVIKRDGKPVAALVDSGLLERLMHVDEDLNLSNQTERNEAIEAIKRWPEHVIGAPMTIEEIISARDEGRR